MQAKIRVRSRVMAAAVALGATMTAAGCTPPGGNAPASQPTTGSTAAVTATCGEDPTTLDAYFESGFPLTRALVDEFKKQFPNVTWKIREDNFTVITQNAPRVLADNPPDLIRVPQVSELVKDNLLLNLDGYAKSLGWDKWPSGQLASIRFVSAEGPRGEGSLYAGGFNYSITGVFYNKKLAAKIGMTEAPKTLAELDALMAKAKTAGIQPITQFNSGASAGLAFPLQHLMAIYGAPGAINDWAFQKPGATIDTESNLKATQHLDGWIKAGYFPKDANSIDYAGMMSAFTAGKALFMFDGDWESANLDKQMPGDVGFFLAPPLEAGGAVASMSAPVTIGVGAGAKNPSCAMFFLDWVTTNEGARKVLIDVGGSHPMGPADAKLPPVKEGSVIAQTLAAGSDVAKVNGTMEFIANATGSIFAKSWSPQLQQLVAGKQTPEGLLQSVQKDYLQQIGR